MIVDLKRETEEGQNKFQLKQEWFSTGIICNWLLKKYEPDEDVMYASGLYIGLEATSVDILERFLEQYTYLEAQDIHAMKANKSLDRLVGLRHPSIAFGGQVGPYEFMLGLAALNTERDRLADNMPFLDSALALGLDDSDAPLGSVACAARFLDDHPECKTALLTKGLTSQDLNQMAGIFIQESYSGLLGGELKWKSLRKRWQINENSGRYGPRPTTGPS